LLQVVAEAVVLNHLIQFMVVAVVQAVCFMQQIIQ
jgi:hypothetical protein